MTDRSERAGKLLNRREFMTRAAIAVGATAAVTAFTRRLPFSPFGKSGASKSPADSIFLPKPGSRLRYWRNRLDSFRLR